MESDNSFNQFLFYGQINKLQKSLIQPFYPIALYKCLVPHYGLTHVDIVLQTIVDLHLLLNGLIPNIQKLIIELRQSRLLS